jgi:hypothetical protein
MEKQRLLQCLFNYVGWNVNELVTSNSNKPTKVLAKAFGYEKIATRSGAPLKTNVFNTSNTHKSLLISRKQISTDHFLTNNIDRASLYVYPLRLTHYKKVYWDHYRLLLEKETLFKPTDSKLWKKLPSQEATNHFLYAKHLNRQIALPIFSAQVLSDHIANQVSGPENRKSPAFRKNLLSGITRFTLSLLKQVKFSHSNVLSGLKVECSGKWKHTASGRKQRLVFKIGNIRAQSFGQQVLSFGFSSANTKFGSCGFKVWASYCFKD